MYIIIAGGGLIGRGMAQRLVENKHDVVVIDTNSQALKDIFSKYGAVTVQGSATDLETLESAGMEKCDVAIAVMPNDADNLAFSILAQHNGIKQIIVRMVDPKYEEVYKSIGIDSIMKTSELLIDQMMISVENPGITKLIGFYDVEICIVEVPDNARCAGKSIIEISKLGSFPEEILIICSIIHETSEFIIPKGDTLVHSLDRLFLCGTRENIQKAAKVISKTGK